MKKFLINIVAKIGGKIRYKGNSATKLHSCNWLHCDQHTHTLPQIYSSSLMYKGPHVSGLTGPSSKSAQMYNVQAFYLSQCTGLSQVLQCTSIKPDMCDVTVAPCRFAFVRCTTVQTEVQRNKTTLYMLVIIDTNFIEEKYINNYDDGIVIIMMTVTASVV